MAGVRPSRFIPYVVISGKKTEILIDMNATKKDIVDFDFIFSEMIRLKKLLNESYEAFDNDFDDKYGALAATINAPLEMRKRNKEKRHIQLHLSATAQKKIWEITRRKIKENNLELVLSESELVSEIKDSIYLQVINQQKFDGSGYSKLLSRALKSIKRKMSGLEYFLPFNASGVKNSTEILFGKVKLVHKDILFNKINDNKHIDKFKKENNKFNAFLCIKISGCSNELSKRRTDNIANLVFGIIQLFGFRYRISKNHVSLDSNPSPTIIDNYIILGEDEKYSLCGSVVFATGFEGFWQNLPSELSSPFGGIVIKLINYAISPTTKECIADRLIDAIYWFGDASRDNNKNSQIVKLVTSLERLVTLSGDKKDYELTARFCDRLGSLISKFYGEIDMWKSYEKELYKLRSRLVHGSQSQCKTYENSLSFDPFMFTSNAIFSICIEFNKIGLDKENKYEAELLKLFNSINKDCYEINT